MFPDADGAASGELYEDDGTTYAYEGDAWSVTRFTYRDGDMAINRSG